MYMRALTSNFVIAALFLLCSVNVFAFHVGDRVVRIGDKFSSPGIVVSIDLEKNLIVQLDGSGELIQAHEGEFKKYESAETSTNVSLANIPGVVDEVADTLANGLSG